MTLKTKIYAPASKSYLQRAMAVASLAEGKSVLRNISWCDDTLAVRNIIRQLGAKVKENERNLLIESRGLNVLGNSFNAGESGLALRMFSPVLALSDKMLTFNGKGSLLHRPVSNVADALRQLGVDVSTNGNLPIKIRGPLKPGKIEIDGSLTSQVLTGLLIALPLAEGDTEIYVHNLNSKPYVDMTLEVMKQFGVEVVNDNYQLFKVKGKQKYRATDYSIEGDWSGAAFILVAGAITGDVEVLNLDYNSKQADKVIVDVLKSAGAGITIYDRSVVVRKGGLNAFEFDATDCPDLFPPLVCLAAVCDGTSVVKGVSRLRYKESNRAEILQEEFKKIGVKIDLLDDYMKITGSKIKGGIIDSRGDHRIAMAAGVMNLISEAEISISGKDAVNKSYPGFFSDLQVLS